VTVISISAGRPSRAVLLLAALVAMCALVAVSYLLGGLLPALLVALALAVSLLARAALTLRPHRAAPAPYEPRPQLDVALEDGSVLQAIVAPVAQEDGRRLVLTARGYLLLDADGRVIYRLN
jgi:hypothetical protein